MTDLPKIAHDAIDALSYTAISETIKAATPTRLRQTQANFTQLCGLFGEDANDVNIRGELLVVAAGLEREAVQPFFDMYQTMQRDVPHGFRGRDRAYVVRATAVMYTSLEVPIGLNTIMEAAEKAVAEIEPANSS